MILEDFYRLNYASKSIETDACEAYFTTKERYGSDVANALIILYLRLQFNPNNQYPAPDDVNDKVLKILRENGILDD